MASTRFKEFNTRETVPGQRNSFGDLNVGGSGGTVECCDALDGQAGGEVLALRAATEILHKLAHGAITFDLVINHARRGQGADDQHGDNNEHFHCDNFLLLATLRLDNFSFR